MRFCARIVLLILLSLTAFCLAEEPKRVLHVSTIPGKTDIYLGNIHPDHSDLPNYRSPSFIEISDNDLENGRVLISLFKPEFRDTSIYVALSPKDTSYLIVSMTPVYESSVIEDQNRELSKRSRRSFGHKIMLSSIIPFVVSGAAGLITFYEIDQANKAKKNIEETVVSSGDKLKQTQSDFRDYKDNAKLAKKTAIAGAITGLAMLSIGFVLSF
ncbi:MAG: hypothetical protein MJZ26_08325 [Fibrobacter sp.]|nr:hypothetical protein [Fibrobacter sp.]